MDAIYKAKNYPFLEGEAIVGLDEDFIVRAHLLLPNAEANNLYSWLLNIQVLNDEDAKRYEQSKEYEENDIYTFSDPSISRVNTSPSAFAILMNACSGIGL